MLTFDLYNILIISGIIFAALVTFGLIIARLYRRSSKEISFVRTGWGGEKVILGGGAIVLPVLHEIIQVNMNTLRLEVRRADDQALITRDRMRVDVMAEFYVRVKPTADSIATAAQTLGQKTMSPNELKNLVEGKFVDSLRAVAAEMAMEELHQKRVDFVQKVQQVVSEDLHKNGLELETVSLTGLDQTGFKYFNPQNAFDAEGLTKLTETIEDRRRKRNHIEQDTDLAIKTKNLEAEQARLQIIREEEYAKLQQEREIAIRRAEQKNADRKQIREVISQGQPAQGYKANPQKAQYEKEAAAEEMILSLILHRPDLAKNILKQTPDTLFVTDFNRKLLSLLRSLSDEGQTISLPILNSLLGEEERTAICAITARYDEFLSPDKIFFDCKRRLEEASGSHVAAGAAMPADQFQKLKEQKRK